MPLLSGTAGRDGSRRCQPSGRELLNDYYCVYPDLTPESAEQVLIEAKPYIDSALEEPGCHAYSRALDPNPATQADLFTLE